MTEQVNKAYNFRKIELAILFSLKGVKELYGFDLSVPQNLDRYLINQTLFELSRREIVTVADKKAVINSEIDKILDGIARAGSMLLFANQTGEYPEQCIYLGEEIVSVQMSARSVDIVRIEGIEREQLPLRMIQMGLEIEQVVTDDILFKDEELICPEIAEIAKHAFEKEKNQILEEEHVRACLITISLLTRKKEALLLLISKGVGDYIVVSNGTVDTVYAYSEKKLMKIVGNCIEGGDR